MPERQSPHATFRLPELESDSVLDASPERWAKAALRMLGIDDAPDIASLVGLPVLGMAAGKATPRRMPGLHAKTVAPGPRIPRNSQAGVGTPEQNMAKIPRFRSELGTFIKHEGAWWRLAPDAGDVKQVTLELLPPGTPEPGTVPKVLQRKVISADDLIRGIRKAKGVREPQ